jgi:hypothetical protein
MIGYDGIVSLENEDLTMDPLTALKKSTQVLKEALPKDFEYRGSSHFIETQFS